MASSRKRFVSTAAIHRFHIYCDVWSREKTELVGLRK